MLMKNGEQIIQETKLTTVGDAIASHLADI